VLRFDRVPRLPPWPRWAIALTVLWLLLVGLAQRLAPGAVLCTFKRLTGVPCAGCGLTRGVTAIAKGDVARGLAYNPLLLTALLLFLLLAALRLVAGLSPRVRLTRAWLLVAILLLAANWAYVIHREMGEPHVAASAAGRAP